MLKEKILHLRSQGYTYNQIVEELGCSKSTVSYHCGEGQKEKTKLRLRKTRDNQHPFVRKIEYFQNTTSVGNGRKTPISTTHKLITGKLRKFERMSNKDKDQPTKPSISVEEVLNYIGPNPSCYLTGEPIDINKPTSYSFDHIIPHSRGGKNTLDNLGLCTRQANQCKTDLTPDELIQFCKNVLTHNGYEVKRDRWESNPD